MKVLGINASPRIGGNSDTLLDKALEGSASRGAVTMKISLEGLKIAPVCDKEYDSITDQGLSVVKDDLNKILQLILEADTVIIASPIYFGSLTAQAKTMIDRFQCVWLAKNIFNKEIFTDRKRGAFICAEATDRKDFFENAKFIVKHFFATINTEYSAEMLATGLDKKENLADRPELLSEAFELGVKLAGLAKEGLMTRRVTVYSTPTCPFCIRVKKFLTESKVEFRDIDVSADESMVEEMVRKSGQMGVPVVDIDGEIIVGFDKGRIAELLGIKA